VHVEGEMLKQIIQSFGLEIGAALRDDSAY
jgi:hypothetical protein